MTLEFAPISEPAHKERFPATVSVSLLLTHGRSGRLFMVRRPSEDETGVQNRWGLIAGGIGFGENSWLAALREASEEANINSQNIIFVKGRDSLEPHVALIPGRDKNRVGIVYSATYSGPKFPLKGREIKEDKVNWVTCFSWKEIIKLLDGPESNIYRPEFNVAQLIRWTIEQAGHGKNLSRAMVVDDWLNKNQDRFGGLSLVSQEKIQKPNDLLSKWNYIPHYNAWMTAKNIHGDPSRTNFARTRFNPNR